MGNTRCGRDTAEARDGGEGHGPLPVATQCGASDHGHDHIGNDRGAETHPFLGYNFRISELNAAVGLAQFRRIDEFIALQKKHYKILRDALEPLDGVTFRSVPEGGEESCAFLNFFLEDLETAREVSKMFKANGLDVCFHYYDNNWHYIRKWDHLKMKKSLYPLSSEIQTGLDALKEKNFAKCRPVASITVLLANIVGLLG